jgi:hypothetical protein
VPVRPSGDVNLGASFIAFEALLPAPTRSDGAAGKPSDPAETTLQLPPEDTAVDMDVSSGEVDAPLAVRRERVTPGAADRGAKIASRLVDYFVSVPGDPGRWSVAAFLSGAETRGTSSPTPWSSDLTR